jgi:hypothetical protein
MESTQEIKQRIIPVKVDLPYSISDLSVVIPQASQYVRRIKWFIPQYIKNTPSEVVRNTIVTYDPEDEMTRQVLADNGIKGVPVSPPHSTFKMQAGFDQVMTRLCVRMHNDCFIRNPNWAQALINQFNTSPSPQLIGAFNISGGLPQEYFEKIMATYPALDKLYSSLEFTNGSIGACYFSAYFMAAQTMVFRGIYPQVIDVGDGQMVKEDVVLTYLAAFNNVQLTFWRNMFSFVSDVGAGYGDFDEDFKYPTEADYTLGVKLSEAQFSPVL